ncbi:MAG: levanase, partial [Bacteroidota bacterium]|nr:levanase [Bacteroidota bacterium]
MKAVFLSFALFVFVLSLYGKSKQDNDELYRPQSHFSPAVNWMGNPSGLIYQNGEYHLFYQLNPYQNQSGQFNLGHAVSTNLVTWTNLPVAIKAEALDTSDVRIGSAWSGSVIVDENNLLKKQTSSSKTWVMFYSVFKKGIKIAYSTDNGKSWNNSEN